MSEWVAAFISAALCSVAVKLLDDYLDREIDEACGEPNSVNRLGEGAVAYCLPALASSVAFQPEIGACLFFASWAVGMYHDLNASFPSGLRGWQESLLVCLTGWYLFTWQSMLWTILLAGGVQLFDDIVDQRQDKISGMRNLACYLGTLQCSVLCGVLVLSSCYFAPGVLFLPVLCGVIAVYAMFAKLGRGV